MVKSVLEEHFLAIGHETGAALARAIRLFNCGKYEEAEISISKARALSPHDAPVAICDGKVKLKTGRISEAARLFADGVRLADPATPINCSNWAESLSCFFELRVHHSLKPDWWTKADLLQMSARAVEIAEADAAEDGEAPEWFAKVMEMRATVLASGGHVMTTFNNRDDVFLWPSRAELREAKRVLERGARVAHAQGYFHEVARLLELAMGIAGMAEDPEHDALRDEAAAELAAELVPA